MKWKSTSRSSSEFSGWLVGRLIVWVHFWGRWIVPEWVCFGGWVDGLFLNGCVLFWWVGEYCFSIGVFWFGGWVGGLFLNRCVLLGGWVDCF